MRDILITAIVALLLVYTLRRPVVGAYSWVWLGLMNPHRLAYGFARTLPFAQSVALVTLLSMLMNRRDRHPLPINGITILLMLLMAWMTLTSFFAINTPDLVFERWLYVFKIQFMLFVTLMLVRGRQQIERLILVMAYSVGFFGVKGGIWTVMTGGGGRVWGPSGGLIEGNNELAVALVMLVPLLFYTYQVLQARWARWAVAFSMACIAFSILGSQSRGALMAVLAMAMLLGLKSQHPVRASMVIGVVTAIALGFMPSSWTERMDTIQTYQSDSSAMSRLYAWKTLWACAVDRPLVGAGFRADVPEVYLRYAPQGPEYAGFENAFYVAHSIYLQILGEHGFPGMLLFLLIGVATWRMAGRLKRLCTNDPEFGNWVPLLMPMVQVSLVGYAVGGAFLSLAYFDLPYYIVSLVILVEATVSARLKTRTSTPGWPPTSSSAARPSVAAR